MALEANATHNSGSASDAYPIVLSFGIRKNGRPCHAEDVMGAEPLAGVLNARCASLYLLPVLLAALPPEHTYAGEPVLGTPISTLPNQQ